jgi:antitoxin component YwqK of YwqJK toxin-antitoxin module
MELDYNLDSVISELYYDLNNDLFYGTFEHIDKEKNIVEYIKIKNGLRNGVSKTYDLYTKKLILKEKYVNGVKDM